MSWVDICTWCCRNRNSINSQQAHHFPFVFCHRSRCGQKKVVAEPCSVCHDAVLSAVTRPSPPERIHRHIYIFCFTCDCGSGPSQAFLLPTRLAVAELRYKLWAWFPPEPGGRWQAQQTWVLYLCPDLSCEIRTCMSPLHCSGTIITDAASATELYSNPQIFI